MTVIRKWSGDGLAEGTFDPVTSVGTGDTAFDYVFGNAPTIVSSGTRPPQLAFVNTTTTASFVQWQFTNLMTVGSGRAYITMPDAWPSISQELIALANGPNPVFRIAISGTGGPGQVRIIDSTGAKAATSATGLIQLSARYRVEWAVNFTTGQGELHFYDDDTYTEVASASIASGGNFGAAGYNRVSIGITHANPNMNTTLFDDMLVDDTYTAIGPNVDDFTLESHLADFQALAPSGTRQVYVATDGDDTNDGSSTAPYATIQKALDGATAGDEILIRAGTYTASSNMYGKNGTSTSWIVIRPENDGDKVILDGTGSGDGAGVLYFQQCSYVGVYGLEVKATISESPASLSGIAIFRGCHHMLAWQNRIHDLPSGGINCFWVPVNTDYGIPAGSHDMLDIRWNTIYKTAVNDPNNSSGISIAEPTDMTSGATWDDGYAYHIQNNYCFNNYCTQPYTAGGFNFVTDGNGISIDAFHPSNHPTDVPNYDKPVLVSGNILTGNGGRGVHVHNALNTDIKNNIGIGNLRTDSSAINNQSEFDGDTDTTVVIGSNAILPTNTPNWKSGSGQYNNNIVLGGTQAVDGTNTDLQDTGFEYFTGPIDANTLTTEHDRAVFATRQSVGLTFTVWDGTQEVPVTITLWDGTQEVAVDLSVGYSPPAQSKLLTSPTLQTSPNLVTKG